MKTSTKIWLIIAIISNIALLFFFQPIINSVYYTNGVVSVAPTVEAIVGILLFLLANISGMIVFARFVKSQPFSRQIFFNTLIPTITFISLLFFIFNITTMKQIGVVAAIRDGLAINTSAARYLWMGIITAVYAIYLLITYFIISRPVRKLEKALDTIRRGGEPTKNINLGGSREFQAIEDDIKYLHNEIKQGKVKTMPADTEFAQKNER